MQNHRSVAVLTISVVGIIALFAADAAAQLQSWDSLRIIVEFRDRTRMGDIDSLLGGNGFTAEKSLGDSATYLVRIPKEWTVEEAIENVSRRDPVEYAGANRYCRLPEAAQMSQAFLDFDSDPFVPGASPGDYYGQYATTKIAIPLGMQMAMGDGQLIALIDNGVDFAHPALSGLLSSLGYDFVDSDVDPGYESGEYAGHGTFSAGLIALGAPHAMILPVRALDGDGRGTVFDICMGIEHAIALESGVLCLEFSLGIDDRILRGTLSRADSVGAIIVAPAGNDSSDVPAYPAAYPFVMGVGATDSLDVKSSFSNYGPSVDVCAPGADIYSTLPGGDVWGRWDGTSFATPLVGALAGLVRELHPTAPADACTSIITWACETIDSLNASFAGLLGGGRVDYARTTGYDSPVLALWGRVTDAVGTGHPDVSVEIDLDGELVTRSTTYTDSSGFYATASPGGIVDIVFTPPPTTGHDIAREPGVAIWNDMDLSIVLSDLHRGDLNFDGVYDIIDVVALIEYAFRDGVAPDPEQLADISCDGVCNIVDVVSLIGYAFRGGTMPACP